MFDLFDQVREDFGFIGYIIFFIIFAEGTRRIIAWTSKDKYDGTNPDAPSDVYGCPQCRYEYEKHVKICPVCKVPMVENIKEAVMKQEAEIQQDIADHPDEDFADYALRHIKEMVKK